MGLVLPQHWVTQGGERLLCTDWQPLSFSHRAEIPGCIGFADAFGAEVSPTQVALSVVFVVFKNRQKSPLPVLWQTHRAEVKPIESSEANLTII